MSGVELGELIRRAAAGDRDAAGELVRRYEAPLRAAIHRRLGANLRTRVDTDDIFQSAIFESVENLATFRYRGEQAFLAWLTTLAEHRLRDQARYHAAAKRDHRMERPLPPADEVPEDRTTPTQGAVRTELGQRLREAVARLADLDRQVVELHSFEGLGFKEIAERLGLGDKNAARWVFQRALNRMEDLLEPRQE